MAKFEFDLEEAENELDNVENLFSVFWGFFNEERPIEDNIDANSAEVFVRGCKPYESVLNAAWDKVRCLRANMEAAIEKHYHSKKSKGGEAA